MPDAIAHHAALDARMVAAARGIRLLGLASWAPQTQQRFLAAFAAGRREMPEVVYPTLDFAEARRELAAVEAAADAQHPLGAYLIESAQSWDVAARLLEALGTGAVTAHAVALYGRPDAVLPGGALTTCDAARHFLRIAEAYDPALLGEADDPTVDAATLQVQLQGDLDAYFGVRLVEVALDAGLIAKAAAGAYRLRLRADARYSPHDRAQLLQHEAFVHSLTALNGRAQAVLPSLAMAAPRTTATQEGLAVFAEQITGSLDIARMKRISLRTEAIARALDGADFLQVFDYFHAAGQAPAESFASAQRVFRGVPLSGGYAFTKDTVYLRGLIDVHTFFRQALAQRQLPLCRQLFAGKMTLDDVHRFAPLFDDGTLQPPHWLPPWLARAGGLAGMLAFSLFANRIRLDQL
ncbi:flavohemoglobin expression-modulating QEGLA motif protein [Luteimonas sp. S4-F44]|uniref:flavohemoglobin expression-modulating QEGLA motif protein n=1 Tax=Luteimonas sp. S4-F44 TaxID=2925842 RepID=UPI001F53D5AA|nr:flavohemoglobin expression-modulating QEGLA motif protein [Luteimonas sp. S4-F44]UNK42151.1 flavohemoglobin expression-modulating QEGLA motif protein [Luteimonas sp. S4-F44]